MARISRRSLVVGEPRLHLVGQRVPDLLQGLVHVEDRRGRLVPQPERLGPHERGRDGEHQQRTDDEEEPAHAARLGVARQTTVGRRDRTGGRCVAEPA